MVKNNLFANSDSYCYFHICKFCAVSFMYYNTQRMIRLIDNKNAYSPKVKILEKNNIFKSNSCTCPDESPANLFYLYYNIRSKSKKFWSQPALHFWAAECTNIVDLRE